MSKEKRFYVLDTDCEPDTWVDTENSEVNDYRDIEKILDEQLCRISDLEQKLAVAEKKLENAIVPKFKIGDKAYAITNEKVESVEIVRVKITRTLLQNENITMYSFTDSLGYALSYVEEDLFVTKEEAEQALKEMKSEQGKFRKNN